MKGKENANINKINTAERKKRTEPCFNITQIPFLAVNKTRRTKLKRGIRTDETLSITLFAYSEKLNMQSKKEIKEKTITAKSKTVLIAGSVIFTFL